MVKTRRFCTLVTLLLAMLVGSSAWAASVSGTVTNATGKSGRIYLTVSYQYGGSANVGTSISGAGSFTISGVQYGQCSIRAFVDTQGSGIQHANDPAGMSVTVSVPQSGSVSVGSFAVSTPAPEPAQAPQVIVYPGNGGNFVLFDGPQNANGLPLADKYTVSWSTSATGSPVAGSKDVWSGDKDFFVHLGGASSLYYRVTATGGGSSAASAWVRGTAPTGTGSVTGKIFFPGVAVTGPLFVALADESTSPPRFHVVAVASPTSGGTFSATNVPAGTYSIYPVLDLNNSGTYDPGDIGPADSNDFNPSVTVSTGAVAAADITLVNENASTVLTTGHGKGNQYEWYNLNLASQSMKKQVVKAQLLSGPQLPGLIDLGLEGNQFRAWLNVSRPTVGDSYQIRLTYADASTETVTRAVSAVLDTFPTALAPSGYIDYNPTPTFSWQPPSPAPAEYNYSIWVSEVNGSNGIWDAWSIPSSQRSIVYGSQGDVMQDVLTDGVSYNWSLNVTDRNGNQAQTQATFTPTGGPALSGFYPPGGLPGTSVTISGLHFSTTPSQNTVYFHGIPAAVSAATSTTLTVTVPAGATTGTIQVTTGGQNLISDDQFIVAAPINVRGTVKTAAGAPIAGARVETVDNPGLYTTTAVDGSFTLQPLFPGQNVTLKITKTGYVPTYTNNFYLDASLDLTPYPSHLYTQADLTAWGVVPGKGAVIGEIFNTGTTPFSPVAGAVVSASSSLNFGAFAPVTYFNGSTFGGSSTYANGFFFVFNVSDYDSIRVDASKSAWNFNSDFFLARANSVTEAGIFGSTFPPNLYGFTPAAGKAGTAVVISGSNFSSVPAENAVKFNGVAATVTAASSDSLTVTVPVAASTGPISVTTAGGTSSSFGTFTMRHTLAVSVTGSGGAGTVTSVPVGIACTGLGCTALFDQGTPVELVATAQQGSRLSAWSGACTGTGTCAFTMNADKSVGAVFDALLYIKNGGNYYSLLQSAFDAAANGNTIQAQAQVFTSSAWVFDRPGAVVTLKGGYDGSFVTNPGFTTLDGRLNLQGGTLRVQKVKIK